MNQEGHWLQHAIRNSPWRVQARTAAWAAVIVLAIVIVGSVYLTQAARSATAGRELQEMERRRDQLLMENDLLMAQIAELKAVPRLQSRALALGFRPADATTLEYLPVERLPPLEEALLPPVIVAEETEPPLPAYKETLGGWLRQQWERAILQWREWSNGSD